MKFCTNCGAQLADGTKFCTGCGQKVQQEVPQTPVAAPTPVAATPAEPAAAAAVHVYGAPVSHNFSAPVNTESQQSVVHTYGAPVSHSFAPPAQVVAALSGTYGGPAAAPSVPVAPAAPVAPAPAQPAAPASAPQAAPAPVEYVAPAPVATAVKAPKAPKAPKMKGGKKPVRLGLLIALAVVIIVILISCIAGGGKDKDDPNLGVYNGVSCTYAGMELGADGEWIELKSGGKLTIMLMGEKYSGKWELNGEELTVQQGGDTFYGTLEDGVIVLDLSDVIYTYEKEASEENDDEAPEADAPEKDDEEPTPAQKIYYTAISGTVSGAEMNESTLSQMGGVSLVFNGDGTGTFDMFGQVDDITYDDSTVTRMNMPMGYSVEGEYLYLQVSEEIEFTFMPKMDAMNRPHDELTLDDIGYWEGDYYGWWLIENVIEGNSSAEGNWWDCCMTLDINADGSGTLVIWDEDYGKNDPIAEVEVSVSNYAGVTRIVSESGQFMGDPVEHADWLFYSDATSYEDSLGFTATYEDDSTKMDCYFFLRQWGTIWDDVEEKDLPGYYESWYLPLLDDGVTEAPETIG